MKKEMLINAVHPEQKRMAIVEDGKLVEYNIQMAVREPITGNIYKGIVMKVERGLQAAFVNYGGKKDGFLPLRDVSPEYFTEKKGSHKDGGSSAKPTLKVGQEVIVQVLREVSERKGALLTTYISLPGRYLVMLPNKQSSGISRKIEDEDDRKRLKTLMEQVKVEENIGFIIRTAGMNRTKQELSRDYQHLLRLWKEILKKNKSIPAPALIYQESDFGICSMRDYFTSEIDEIWVDEVETWRKMKAYCKTVAPRNVKMIKLYKEKNAIFDKYRLEDQIRIIYEAQVTLKSGGYVIIEPTEAMTTIDVNSGRASNKKNVEETAFKTNIEAAEEIAKQLRLRDLGGLIVIDFIDMRDRKHEAEVEKTFKKALSVDRARIQLSRISKFGLLELSRQKKQSTIQEISYMPCPFCKGSGVRPSLEYTALSAFRMMESRAVTGKFADLKIILPYEISDYLLNMKRSEISKLETTYDVSIRISGAPDMAWDDMKIQTHEKEIIPDIISKAYIEAEIEPEPAPEPETQVEAKAVEKAAKIEEAEAKLVDENHEIFYQTLALEGNADETVIDVGSLPPENELPKKKQRRRPRRRNKRKAGDRPDEMEIELLSESIDETVLIEGYLKVYEDL